MTSIKATRRRAMTNTSALADIIKELVITERNYVKKLRILKTEYGDPLRTFSREKTTAIIPPYEAKTLFGNIDQLLPVNEAFLADLEKMDQDRGPGVGDVALKHFKTLKGFECYRQYYAKHEEVQKLFEREVKKNARFADYIEVRRLLPIRQTKRVTFSFSPACQILHGFRLEEQVRSA